MERKEISDKDLVARAAKRDKQAYRVLVERYQSRAYNIAFDILKSREDAEDVVQESFVKAYLSLGSFKGQSSFYTWLYRIVYNMAVDFKRKVLRRGGYSAEYDESQDVERVRGSSTQGSFGSVGPFEGLLHKEQGKRILEVLNELSDEHRAVIVLREVEGMNYDQISESIGISKGTVMSRLHYARKKLQRALRDYAPEGKVTEGAEMGTRGGEDSEDITKKALNKN